MSTKPSYYNDYVQILKEELITAMGCTEPIAIAYAGAVARETLGDVPTAVTVSVSGNIIKNVKSVIVPNTGGQKGIAAAAAAGIVAGEAKRKLEVLSQVTPAQIEYMKEYLAATPIEVVPVEQGHIFDIGVRVSAGEHSAYVRIVDFHTNIVAVEKDGEAQTVENSGCSEEMTVALTDRAVLNVKDIIAFADEVDLEEIRPILSHQVECNMAISAEGLKNSYGANIGKVLLNLYGDDVKIKAKAWAAAGSDARMNGCEMPVVINSGSGNQGITASVPVVVYARELGVDEERMYRALVVSNLCTIHLKTGIGRLSAYCGAISAGCGSGAGIAYLLGGGYREVAHTLVNSLAIVSGIVCDGAKASCAGKIAAAVDAGILGYHMFLQGNQFVGGDGIVKKGVENTIENVGRLAHDGMAETDKEIIQLMVEG
ncbi:MAG: serine dehydratase subunit alpha family protein [Lachnospiraceae bacterium]|nr:serine dehydratase subunit alpha family protein [Lachnospiraceae bacterium]